MQLTSSFRYKVAGQLKDSKGFSLGIDQFSIISVKAFPNTGDKFFIVEVVTDDLEYKRVQLTFK